MAVIANLLGRGDALVARAGGLHPPPKVLMAWPKPNRIDPETRGWEAPIVLIIVLAITFFVYTARMWARLVVAKNAGVDDLLMSIAMVPLMGLTIAVVLGKMFNSMTRNHANVPQVARSMASNGMRGTRLIALISPAEK